MMSVSSSSDKTRGERRILRVFYRIVEDVKDLSFWRAALSEFLGTMLLVFFAVGAGLHDYRAQPSSSVHLTLESGFFITVIVGSLQHVSGAHVNPAVSLAFLIVSDISMVRFLVYSIAQTLGSVAGAIFLKAVTPQTMHGDFGVLKPGPDVSAEQALIAEFVISFFLIFGILTIVDKGRRDVTGSTPLHIGLIVCINMFSTLNISGGGMNPARNFGPALVAASWEAHWVYWAGPLLGSVIAAVLYDKVLSTRVLATDGRHCMLGTSNESSEKIEMQLEDGSSERSVLFSPDMHDNSIGKCNETALTDNISSV